MEETEACTCCILHSPVKESAPCSSHYCMLSELSHQNRDLCSTEQTWTPRGPPAAEEWQVPALYGKPCWDLPFPNKQRLAECRNCCVTYKVRVLSTFCYKNTTAYKLHDRAKTCQT